MKTIINTKYVKNIFASGLMLFAAAGVVAQEEEEKKISISGSVDAYYQTNLSASDATPQSFGSSFANELGFALGMANIVAAYEGEKNRCSCRCCIWP